MQRFLFKQTLEKFQATLAEREVGITEENYTAYIEAWEITSEVVLDEPQYLIGYLSEDMTLMDHGVGLDSIDHDPSVGTTIWVAVRERLMEAVDPFDQWTDVIYG